MKKDENRKHGKIYWNFWFGFFLYYFWVFPWFMKNAQIVIPFRFFPQILFLFSFLLKRRLFRNEKSNLVIDVPKSFDVINFCVPLIFISFTNAPPYSVAYS